VNGRTFIDTNVFVYADDADVPEKQAIAQDLIRELAAGRRGVISTQVLTEYVAAGRRRLGLSLLDCRQAVLLMCRLKVVVLTPEHVLAALDLAASYSLSHWDALIVKAASAGGCRRLITEDLQHGQVLDGVTIENPFRSVPAPRNR
jgi:predicted nucleic acid-binding protein